MKLFHSVHKGHTKAAMQSPSPYEPKSTSPDHTGVFLLTLGWVWWNTWKDNTSAMNLSFQIYWTASSQTSSQIAAQAFNLLLIMPQKCVLEINLSLGRSTEEERHFYWAMASVFQACGIQMPVWKQHSLSQGRHTHTPHKNRFTSQNKPRLGMQILLCGCCRARGAPQMCLV